MEKVQSNISHPTDHQHKKHLPNQENGQYEVNCYNGKHRRCRGDVQSCNYHFPFLLVINYWDCRSVCIAGFWFTTTVDVATIACSIFLFLAALIWSANETSARNFSLLISSTSNFSKPEICNWDVTMSLRLATWPVVVVSLSSCRKSKSMSQHWKTRLWSFSESE